MSCLEQNRRVGKKEKFSLWVGAAALVILPWESWFKVLPSCQDTKTNSFVGFFGEVTARQFCFEIYWPLAFQLGWAKQKSRKKENFSLCFGAAALVILPWESWFD